jgi:hypothetical protein
VSGTGAPEARATASEASGAAASGTGTSVTCGMAPGRSGGSDASRVRATALGRTGGAASETGALEAEATASRASGRWAAVGMRATAPEGAGGAEAGASCVRKTVLGSAGVAETGRAAPDAGASGASDGDGWSARPVTSGTARASDRSGASGGSDASGTSNASGAGDAAAGGSGGAEVSCVRETEADRSGTATVCTRAVPTTLEVIAGAAGSCGRISRASPRRMGPRDAGRDGGGGGVISGSASAGAGASALPGKTGVPIIGTRASGRMPSDSQRVASVERPRSSSARGAG